MNLHGFYTWLVDSRYEDPRGVFTVTNALLRISGDGLGYLATQNSFTNYHLVAEFKWGERNWKWGDRIGKAKDAGIFLNGTGPDGNSHDGGGAFMAAIECNLFQGATGDFLLIRGSDADETVIAPRITSDVRAEKDRDGWFTYLKAGREQRIERWGRLNWLEKSEDWQDRENFRGPQEVEKPPGEWNTVECIVADGRITIFLNGALVNQAREVWPRNGKVLLQCEGSEIFFRRLELLPVKNELSEAPAAGKNVGVEEGRLFIPELLPEKKEIPLLIHLHGHAGTMERSAVRAGWPGVLLTVNRAGLSGAYSSYFGETNVFWKLLTGVQRALPEKKITRVYLSSFSAGFGGVRELLKDSLIFQRVDGLVLADSIYSGLEQGTGRAVDSGKMDGFLRFAREAAAGRKWMLVSHSEQPVAEYASTTETADYLLDQLRLARQDQATKVGGELQPLTSARQGNFQVLGFEGEKPEDHMKHLRNIRLFWQHLPEE